jgi:hypothetical protein
VNAASTGHRSANGPGRTFLLIILLGLATVWFARWPATAAPAIETAHPARDAQAPETFRPLDKDLVKMMLEIESSPDTGEAAQKAVSDIPTNPESQAEESEAAGPPASAPSATEAEMSTESNTAHAPAIEGRFEMPVLDYVEAIRQRAGGKLLVWDRASNRAMGEVINGQFDPQLELDGFSNRARDLTRDLPPGFREPILEQIRASGAFGIFSFVLVIPEKAEQQFKTSVSKALAHRGLAWEDTDLLRLRYAQAGDQLVVRVETALSKGVSVDVHQSVIIW